MSEMRKVHGTADPAESLPIERDDAEPPDGSEPESAEESVEGSDVT